MQPIDGDLEKVRVMDNTTDTKNGSSFFSLLFKNGGVISLHSWNPDDLCGNGLIFRRTI